MAETPPRHPPDLDLGAALAELAEALRREPCRLLTAEHAAELLDTSVKSVRRLLATGELRIVRLSRQQIRIRADDLAEFIDQRTENGP